MIWFSLAGEALSWSAWLWRHRSQFEPILKKFGEVGDFAQATIANPDGTIRRIGNTIVFGQEDGGQRVLAFIEQTAPRIEQIEHAVDGLQIGQAALSTSLSSLQAISMVTLGLTAFTPVVLGAQFFALNRRLSNLQKQIARLHKKFDAAIIADLKAGLDLLRQGKDFLETRNSVNAHDRLTASLPCCIRSMKYFSELLASELNEKKTNRDEVRLLARHLSVAVMAVASCQIGLEQDQHAFAQSTQELSLLRQCTREIFHDTVARDPAPYMLPAMREHGVTLEFMVGLYQQARDAGAADPSKDCSVSGWFEEHRDAIFHARAPWRGWNPSVLRSRLQEAVAAIEETNRVIGLSHLVEQVQASGQSTLGVIEEYRRKVSAGQADAGPFAVWGLA
jgi:hypothetical protein